MTAVNNITYVPVIRVTSSGATSSLIEELHVATKTMGE